MKTSEVLRTAGDLLRARGWCKHARIKEDGSMCAIGAIEMARSGSVGKVHDHDPYNDPVLDLVPLENEFDTVDGFNDRESTGLSDVIQLLDAAYVLALQEEGIEPEDVL